MIPRICATWWISPALIPLNIFFALRYAAVRAPHLDVKWPHPRMILIGAKTSHFSTRRVGAAITVLLGCFDNRYCDIKWLLLLCFGHIILCDDWLLPGRAVDCLRNLVANSLKYCDGSWVRAPAWGNFWICKKYQTIPLAQSTASPSIKPQKFTPSVTISSSQCACDEVERAALARGLWCLRSLAICRLITATKERQATRPSRSCGRIL